MVGSSRISRRGSWTSAPCWLARCFSPPERLASFHDLNLAAAFCDRLYVLDGGRIVAQGTPTEVLDADLLWRVFGVRALVDRHPLADHPRLTWITQA